MFESVCAGTCNAPARRRQEQYDRDLAAWQAALQQWMKAREKAQENGEDVGPAPEKPKEPTLYWVAGTPIWCISDQAAIRSALTALDSLMSLRLMYADGFEASGGSEPVRGSKDPSSPSPAHDQLDELVRWLRDWENEYRTSQRWHTAPYRGESAPALTESIAWHLSHLDRILAHASLGATYGEGVLWWHRSLDAAAKTRRRRVTKPLRCPQCKMATLSQMEGEDRVECRYKSCGENRGGPLVWTIAEYEAYAAEVAPTAKQARETLHSRREVVPFGDYGRLSGRA